MVLVDRLAFVDNSVAGRAGEHRRLPQEGSAGEVKWTLPVCHSWSFFVFKRNTGMMYVGLLHVAVIPKSKVISEDNKGWGGGLFGLGCCTRMYRQIVRPLEGHDTQLPLTHFLAKGGMYGVETCLLRWRLAIVLALTRIYRNRVGSCCSLLSTTLDAPPQARPAGKVERGGGV